MGAYWGVDLGGTKIEGAVLSDEKPPRAISRIRIPTEAHHGYEHILSRVALLLEQLSSDSGERPKVLGLGHPGTHDPISGRLKNSNTTCLNGKPLQGDLESLLGITVRAANDANCFVLAEGTMGAARGGAVVFGVIMGTGVGGGILVDGRVIEGCQGIAGEWGHNVLIENGPQCYCGKCGCVETLLSGPALERYYEQLSGQSLGLPEIAGRADLGDSAAVQVLGRFTELFGRALAAVINILDPHVVVLGGGVSNLSCLYSEGIRQTKRFVFCDCFNTRIVKHQLGDSAGVIGAALLTAHEPQ